jgi:hypothetical protein
VQICLTGLGEEGAEALVGIGGFAFRSEVAIGLLNVSQRQIEERGQAADLNTVFEAIQLLRLSAMTIAGTFRSSTYLPTRVGNLATGLAD